MSSELYVFSNVDESILKRLVYFINNSKCNRVVCNGRLVPVVPIPLPIKAGTVYQSGSAH